MERRILARRLARELTPKEIEQVTGGHDHEHGIKCGHYTTVNCSSRWDDGG